MMWPLTLDVWTFTAGEYRIDTLTGITGVAFADAWARRLRVEIDGIALSVLSRDDQIANKRAVGRPQDLADATRLKQLSD